MNEELKELYDAEVRKYKSQYYGQSDDAKKLILRDLRYKNMHMINPDLLVNLDKHFDD